MARSYEAPVHQVMDHIRNHLDQDLSLHALASVAGFSPFHFHRIFKEVTGETAAQFTRRARLERAVDLMRGAPGRSLASIGAEVGFATPSEFSRIFKATYGIAPSRWDRRSRVDGTPGLIRVGVDEIGEQPSVILRRRPALQVTCVRIRDPWIGDNMQRGYRSLRSRLSSSAAPWDRVMLLGLSWESGTVTPLDRLTYDLGVATPVDGNASRPPSPVAGPSPSPSSSSEDGALVTYEIPAVTAGEVHADSLPKTAVAWETLYRRWLPESGFEPADHPAIKFFRTVPAELTPQAWDVDCSIAVRRALHQR